MSFSPFLHRVVRAVTPFIFSKSIGGEVFSSDDDYFARSVFVHTGKKILFSKMLLRPDFPQLRKIGALFQSGDIKVQAGATGLQGEEHEEGLSIKTKGEFLERVSATVPFSYIKEGNMANITASSLEKDLVCTSLTHPLSPFFGKETVDSVYIYYGLHFRPSFKRDKPLLWQPTSNGCAGHFDKKKALVSGALELVQRDAFFMWWLTHSPPPHIDVAGYAKEKGGDIHYLLEQIAKYKLKAYFLNTTSDILIPCITVVVTGEDEGDKVPFGVGASSGFDPYSTIMGALTEALSVTDFSSRMESLFLPPSYKPFTDDSLGRKERLAVYTSKKQRKHAEFLYASHKHISVDEWIHKSIDTRYVKDVTSLIKHTQEQLRYLKKYFRERSKSNSDFNLLYYEFKNPLLNAFDYKVVRVMCKGLYNIYLNESFADVSHPRLQEFYNYVHNKDFDYSSITTWPHPFP